MIRVTENFRKIHDLLASAEAEAGRREGSVRLLAVSKKKPVDDVLALAAAGQLEFGENFVQEALDKMDGCARTDLIWHFIGHLQSNKTRVVAERFDWVHTIDRQRIATRLSRQRPAGAKPLNVLLQVNVDGEASKSGVSFAALPALADTVGALPGLTLRGLMCIPAPREGLDAQREPFRRLREARDALIDTGHELDTLSMGMTADARAAVLEGATIVRIGTALFGARD